MNFFKTIFCPRKDRIRTYNQQIKSLLLYHLSYRFILALLSPLPSSENSCSDLGLLFNGIPGCIRTLLICELTSLTLYLGLQIPQQVVSALLLLRWFFIVTPQMTNLGLAIRNNNLSPMPPNLMMTQLAKAKSPKRNRVYKVYLGLTKLGK